MFKTTMLVLVSLAFVACSTASTPPPAPVAKANEGCTSPAFLDKNERYAKGNMGGIPTLGTHACGK